MGAQEEWGVPRNLELAVRRLRDGYLACAGEVILGMEWCEETESLEAPILEVMHMLSDWWEFLEDLPVPAELVGEDVMAFGTERSVATEWRSSLARTVADSLCCRCLKRSWLRGESSSERYYFVGYETSARVASALYGQIVRSCTRIGRRGRRRGELRSEAVSKTARDVTKLLAMASEECAPYVPDEVDEVFGEVVEAIARTDELEA